MAKRMAKNKKVTRTPRKIARNEILSAADSYKSLLYGIATVIILFILGFSLTRMFLNRPKPEIDNKAVSVSRIEEVLKENKKASGTSGMYVVQPNDSLWSIAENKYNDGYKWTEIAKANSIANPGTIFKGDKLVIPAISTSATNQTTTTLKLPLNDTTYVIQRGDDLWGIAVREYGDGYQWVKIAQANNLSNPNLIHVDNTLKIPR